MKYLLSFIGGLIIGGAAGVIGTKKYFQNKYEKAADDDVINEYYRRTTEYAEKDVPSTYPSRASGIMTPEQRKKVKEQLNQQYGTKKVDYAGMYKGPTVNKAEEEHPLDQGEEGEIGPEDLEMIEDSSETRDEEAFDDHQKNKDRSPRIISVDAYENLPSNVEQSVLYFYAYDEVLADENDEMVEEPERLVGDSLTKYGFIDSEERIIFVMNYSLDTCYEIQKLDASWTDSH